jgi:hypothetical protein
MVHRLNAHISFALYSGSHAVCLLVNKYPHYRIVNYDKLDYCSSLKNLASLAGKPNYKFVKVIQLHPLLQSLSLSEIGRLIELLFSWRLRRATSFPPIW